MAAEKAVPQDVEDFLDAYIHSVAQLEILLVLHSHADRDWSPDDLGRDLSIGEDVSEMHLEDLSSRGLLVENEGEPTTYRYSPPAPIKSTIDDLAHAYSTRRVAVIGLIFSKPVDDVRSFADAFRVRKDKKDG